MKMQVLAVFWGAQIGAAICLPAKNPNVLARSSLQLSEAFKNRCVILMGKSRRIMRIIFGAWLARHFA